MTVNDFYNIF